MHTDCTDYSFQKGQFLVREICVISGSSRLPYPGETRNRFLFCHGDTGSHGERTRAEDILTTDFADCTDSVFKAKRAPRNSKPG